MPFFGLVLSQVPLSKKEKRNRSMSQKKRTQSVKKSFKFAFYVVTYLFNFIYLLSKFQNNYFKWNRIQELPIFSCSLWRNNLPGMKVSMGFYRQSLNGVTIHRQPSKDVIFNRQPPKMQFKINPQKISRYFKSYYFS